MFLLIFGLIIVLIVVMHFIFFLCVDHAVHKKQVLDNCKEWNYADFDTFLRYFNRVSWERDSSFPESFFQKERDKLPYAEYKKNYIHASIILFDGKGMILDPISYYKFLRWTKEHTAILDKPVKNPSLWK
jgi:hypothetical protein